MTAATDEIDVEAEVQYDFGKITAAVAAGKETFRAFAEEHTCFVAGSFERLPGWAQRIVEQIVIRRRDEFAAQKDFELDGRTDGPSALARANYLREKQAALARIPVPEKPPRRAPRQRPAAPSLPVSGASFTPPEPAVEQAAPAPADLTPEPGCAVNAPGIQPSGAPAATPLCDPVETPLPAAHASAEGVITSALPGPTDPQRSAPTGEMVGCETVADRTAEPSVAAVSAPPVAAAPTPEDVPAARPSTGGARPRGGNPLVGALLDQLCAVLPEPERPVGLEDAAVAVEPRTSRGPRVRPPNERFDALCRDGANGCRIFHSNPSEPKPMFNIADGKRERATRFAWKRAGNSIEREDVLRVTCGTPRCVNPAHMVVERWTDVCARRDYRAPKRIRRGRRRAQACLRGHEYSPENTYVQPRGSRVCRTCMRQRAERARSEWAKYLVALSSETPPEEMWPTDGAARTTDAEMVAGARRKEWFRRMARRAPFVAAGVYDALPEEVRLLIVETLSEERDRCLARMTPDQKEAASAAGMYTRALALLAAGRATLEHETPRKGIA